MSECDCDTYKKLHDTYFRTDMYHDFDSPMFIYSNPNLICIDSICNHYTCDKCGYIIMLYVVRIDINKYIGLYNDQCWDLKSYIRKDLTPIYYEVHSIYFIIPEIGNAFHTGNELIYFDQPIVKIYLGTCFLADGTLTRCFYNDNNKIIAINQNNEEIDCYVLTQWTSEGVFENEKYKLTFENLETFTQFPEVRYTFINKANGKYTKAAAK